MVLVSCLIPQFFAFQGKDLFNNNKEKDNGAFTWKVICVDRGRIVVNSGVIFPENL